MAKKILVVEDSFAVRLNLPHLLEDVGYAVVTAVDGRDGRQKALAEKPDLIITDLTLPFMDGLKLTKALRAAGVAVPIILRAAFVDGVVRQVARGSGVTACVEKTSRGFDSLLRTVAELLGEQNKGKDD